MNDFMRFIGLVIIGITLAVYGISVKDVGYWVIILAVIAIELSAYFDGRKEDR